MKSTVEFCIFGVALFVAVVAGLYIGIALGFKESIWEPLAAFCGAVGVIGLLGLLRIDRRLEQAPDSASSELPTPG
jgi:hypothetical protein